MQHTALCRVLRDELEEPGPAADSLHGACPQPALLILRVRP